MVAYLAFLHLFYQESNLLCSQQPPEALWLCSLIFQTQSMHIQPQADKFFPTSFLTITSNISLPRSYLRISLCELGNWITEKFQSWFLDNEPLPINTCNFFFLFWTSNQRKECPVQRRSQELFTINFMFE